MFFIRCADLDAFFTSVRCVKCDV